MKFNFRALNLVIFNLVLSIGCFWQIFNVCDLYFKYPTNIFIETNFEPLSKPVPALTFCTHSGNHKGMSSSDALEMDSNTFRNGIFKQIYIGGASGYKHDLLTEYLDTAVESISLYYYCITFNSFLKANGSTKLKWSEVMWLWPKGAKSTQTWRIFLHNPFDMPSSNDYNMFVYKDHMRARITWKLNAFRLLESPYRTDCKNYRTASEYMSRKDCIRKCKLNSSITICGSILNGINLQRGEKSVPFGDPENTSCIEKIDFDSICERECPHYDCNIEYYEPVLVAIYNNVDSPRIELSIPTKPETAYFHEPRIQTIEFICYLASTVSMWFGLSFYSFFYLISLCRTTLIKHFHNKNMIGKVFIKVNNDRTKNIVRSRRM